MELVKTRYFPIFPPPLPPNPRFLHLSNVFWWGKDGKVPKTKHFKQVLTKPYVSTAPSPFIWHSRAKILNMAYPNMEPFECKPQPYKEKLSGRVQ